MAISEKKKREYLVEIIRQVLTTNIALMTYYKSMASDEKSKKTCSKSIKQTQKALEKLPLVNHIEILVSLYNAIVAGKESVFVLGGALMCSKNFDYWDKTEKGFKEFLKLEEENRNKVIAKQKEENEMKEAVAKAKEEGKKVEYVFNPETKKVEPKIIETKDQA
jgi:hypothetical protein